MSIWTLLFVLAFVGMIVMHLRGHGHGHDHGGGHGHGHDDVRRDDAHGHHPGPSASDAPAAEDPRQPVGAAGPHGGHGGHGGHRHGC